MTRTPAAWYPDLPRIDPLARLQAPFDHLDWVFEPKLDGFRAIGYVERGGCRLVSRNGNAFKTFNALARSIGQDLAGRTGILDGEFVRPGPDGRPMFYELMRRRGPFCFCAFDLLWPANTDLRLKPLLESVEAVNGDMKALLRRGRGYTDLRYLLLKAQRMAVTKTEFIVLQKAA